MTTRCALVIDDSSNMVEAEFLEIPRVGEHIQVDGEPQDIRVTRVLHQVSTGADQPTLRIDATTKIL